MFKLGILGVGKMGSAILSGIINGGLISKDEILLCDSFKDNLLKLKGEAYNVTENAEEIFDGCDAFILAIKPQSFGEITEISDGKDFSGKKVVSIAAGIGIDYLKSHFKGAIVARCMPNTPALIGKGVTAIAARKEDAEGLSLAKAIFSSVGKAYETDEDLMDLTVPLNGSMPADLYTFAGAFIDSATRRGVPYETAKALVCESIISSAEMIIRSKDDIETLTKNVCSKGGTTIAGLDRLLSGDFLKSVDDCYLACAERSKELSK